MPNTKEKLIDLLTGYSLDTYEDVQYVADELIAKDVVPVVRCWNCENGLRCRDGYVRCSHPSGKLILMKSSDFCSYGEWRNPDGNRI